MLGKVTLNNVKKRVLRSGFEDWELIDYPSRISEIILKRRRITCVNILCNPTLSTLYYIFQKICYLLLVSCVHISV